jgi:hypothetical protein
MKAERSVEIGRGRKAVWDVLGDPSLLPVWFDDLADFVPLEGDGRDVGDLYRINYTRFRKPIGLKVAVLEAETQAALVQRFTGLPASFTIACSLSGTQRRTTLDAIVEVKLSLVQRAFTPIVSGYIDNLAVGLSEGFKTYVEQS